MNETGATRALEPIDRIRATSLVKLFPLHGHPHIFILLQARSLNHSFNHFAASKVRVHTVFSESEVQDGMGWNDTDSE